MTQRMLYNSPRSSITNCRREPQGERPRAKLFELREEECWAETTNFGDDMPGEKECRELFESHMSKLRNRESRACSICKEDVKNTCGGRGRYGLLDGCDHVFCLPCIREVSQKRLSRVRKYWKTMKISGPQVLCPVCRAPSLFIMSAQTFIDDPERKKRFLSEYIEAGSEIPCEFLRCGFGACFCVDRVHHDGKK